MCIYIRLNWNCSIMRGSRLYWGNKRRTKMSWSSPLIFSHGNCFRKEELEQDKWIVLNPAVVRDHLWSTFGLFLGKEKSCIVFTANYSAVQDSCYAPWEAVSSRQSWKELPLVSFHLVQINVYQHLWLLTQNLFMLFHFIFIFAKWNKSIVELCNCVYESRSSRNQWFFFLISPTSV